MPRIESDVKLDFSSVLIRPKRSTLKSRSEVELCVDYTFRNSKRAWHGVPIIAANMDTTGTIAMATALASHKCMTALHKYYELEDWTALAAAQPAALPYLAISAGSSDRDAATVRAVLDAVPDVSFICLDVANGYAESFVDAVRRTREEFPRHTIFAGNVVTAEITEELILAGADILKIGIGPGSVCTTRRQTGVGYPQLSAVLECADAAAGLGAMVCSDGGCTCPGDVAKAFGAGAGFVMIGGMLSGHAESGGDLIERGEGKLFKRFYGMSSSLAMKKHSGGVAEYRSSEGKAVEVPYRGPVEATMLDLLGGLRSACTYVGARELSELSKRTTFIRVTAQLNESFSMLRPADMEHGYVRLLKADAATASSATRRASAPGPVMVFPQDLSDTPGTPTPGADGAAAVPVAASAT